MLQLINQTTYHRAEIKSQLTTCLHSVVRSNHKDRAAGLRVLLKPNFVMPAPRDDASTTHPQFYMAVAELLLELGCDVGIGESPAIGSCASALKAHGVFHECLQRGIHVVEFKSNQTYTGVPEQKAWQDLTIAAELENWDLVINLPKLKTHQQFTFTAASKNLYGCVTGKRKFFRHNQCANDPRRFAAMIRANAQKANCILHIGDGIEALHVKGPRNGESYPLNRIIIASDHLVHDWLFCHLIDLDPALTPLFSDLSPQQKSSLHAQCESIIGAGDFKVAKDFVHAPLIDISFQPWHLLRSGWRTLSHHFSKPTQASP